MLRKIEVLMGVLLLVLLADISMSTADTLTSDTEA
jgi:hypothetical protein